MQTNSNDALPSLPYRAFATFTVRKLKLTETWLTSLLDLTTVDEDAAIEQQLQDEIDEPAVPEVAEDPGHARRISAHSVMSGTTAKTSFSQEEIGDLDADVMVDVLPSLESSAEGLAKLLVPNDPKSRPVVRKEIRTAGTKHEKLYNNRLASINVHKDSFGSTDYIQPSIVLRALLGVQNMKDVPQGPWRPDAVIYKINLAQMLRSVLILLPGNGPNEIDSEGYNAMESLDVNFGSAIAGPEFRQNAFQLCLSILTQLCIIRLTVYRTDPGHIPSHTVTSTFYAPDEDGELSFRLRNVLHMMDLSNEDQATFTDILQQLSDRIMENFDDRNPDTWMPGLGALRAQYPWDGFVDHVVRYYSERKQELDEQITAVGGIDGIMDSLTKEVERREDARKAEEKRQSFSRPGGTPKKSFAKGGVRALKAREKQLAATAAQAPPASAPVAQMTAQAIQPAPPTAPVDDGWQTIDDDDRPVPPSQAAAQSTARSTLEALSGFQDQQRQNAMRSKGRSFVDRQDGAQRVAWDESQLTQYSVPSQFQYPTSSAPQPGPYYQSPRRNAGKRPYPAVEEEPEEFEPTQDQGFEVDNRDPAGADARRRQVASRAPPQPRFSAFASSAPSGPSSTAPLATYSPSKRRRTTQKNPGSTIPPPPPPFDPDTEYTTIPRSERMQRAKVAARHGTVRASQMKPAQVRTPWSPEEENALIDLIEEEGGEGISYAKLKALDENRNEPVFEKRSAEDLRFKARNMKETFLK